MQRPVPSSIPDSPGSYQFKDPRGRVLYVGKAKSLRSRVMSYFGTGLGERTRQMVAASDSVEWITVGNEVEALFLEFNLIRKHRPRFNIRYMDDKSYPYLAITLDEEWPRAMVMRGAKRKGSATTARTRTPTRSARPSISCCARSRSAPAPRASSTATSGSAGPASTPTSRSARRRAWARSRGRSTTGWSASCSSSSTVTRSTILDRLDKKMHEASDALEFERAARLRDQVVSVRKAIERQQMVDAKEEDYDAIGIVEDELEASVQVFLVRKGRVVGRKGLVVDKVEDLTHAELVGRLLEQLYGGLDAADIPREILVPDEPEDVPLYEEFLATNRGAKVRLRVPKRGAKRALLETVTQNAQEAFVRHKLRRSSDHNARARALLALQEALRLPEAPLRIECFDVSNLQGSEIVASMVVMEDGLAKRSDYRRFKIRHQPGQDDFAAMEEALSRRFRRYLEERDEGARKGKRFAYPPNLLLVDGGKGQLGVAVRVLEDLGPRRHLGREPGEEVRRGLRAG